MVGSTGLNCVQKRGRIVNRDSRMPNERVDRNNRATREVNHRKEKLSTTKTDVKVLIMKLSK